MGISDLNVSGNELYREFNQKKKLEERKSATDSFKVATNRSLHVNHQNYVRSSCLSKSTILYFFCKFKFFFFDLVKLALPDGNFSHIHVI